MGISYLTRIFFVSSSTTDNTAAVKSNKTKDVSFRNLSDYISNLLHIHTDQRVLLPTAYEVCRKVMLSQASACPQGGLPSDGGLLSGDLHCVGLSSEGLPSEEVCIVMSTLQGGSAL